MQNGLLGSLSQHAEHGLRLAVTVDPNMLASSSPPLQSRNVVVVVVVVETTGKQYNSIIFTAITNKIKAIDM